MICHSKPLTTVIRIATLVVALAGLGCPRANASDHAAKPEKSEKAHGESGEAAASEDDDGKNANGVELGKFKVRAEYPVEAQKITVRFVLFATVTGDDIAAVRHSAEEHQQKIRDLVITSTRLAPMTMFEEPDLASFRRRILVRLRRELPELTFDNLYIADFGMMVRSL